MHNLNIVLLSAINMKINKLHYRALRMIYLDETSTFEELLEKDGSVTIHHRNLQFLATEMFKVRVTQGHALPQHALPQHCPFPQPSHYLIIISTHNKNLEKTDLPFTSNQSHHITSQIIYHN